MRDRQKLETLLARRFPGSTREQIAAAVNGIMGLEDEGKDFPADNALVRREPDQFEVRVLRRNAE
jgi:hypothetical protein